MSLNYCAGSRVCVEFALLSLYVSMFSFVLLLFSGMSLVKAAAAG